MKTRFQCLWVWLALLFLNNLAHGQSNTYYDVWVRDKLSGYMIQYPVVQKIWQGQPCLYQRSKTIFHDISHLITPHSKIIEETYRHVRSGKVLHYHLTYWIKFDKGERLCTFEHYRIHLLRRKNGKPVARKIYPLRPDALIMTDYFSLIPILGRVGQQPASFFVCNPKDFSDPQGPIESSSLAVFPKEQTELKMAGRSWPTRHFLVTFRGNQLHVWLDEVHGRIVRLEQRGREAFSLRLTRRNPTKSQLHQWHILRPLPWQNGHTYSYAFLLQNQLVGQVDFIVHYQPQGYRVVAQGEVTLGKRRRHFASQTCYDKRLRPLKYEVKDQLWQGQHQTGSQIECQFVPHGVKQVYRRGPRKIEQAINTPESFILLDNNALQLFAIFASQLPLKVGGKFRLATFHPRRFGGKIAQFQCQRWLDPPGVFVVCMDTGVYRITLWITKNGKLLRYAQGNLVVLLKGVKLWQQNPQKK